MPNDWVTMNPILANVYGSRSSTDGGLGKGAIVGIVFGSVLGFVLIAAVLAGFLWKDRFGISKILHRNDKEADTGVTAEGSSNGMVSGGHSEFVGGQSVYKKTSSHSFVTADALEADGAVLTEAMEEQMSPSKTDLQEVNLDDLPSSLEEEKQGIV